MEWDVVMDHLTGIGRAVVSLSRKYITITFCNFSIVSNSVIIKHPLFNRAVTAKPEVPATPPTNGHAVLEWETMSIGSSNHNCRSFPRCGSVSSSISMSETSSANSSNTGGMTSNQSINIINYSSMLFNTIFNLRL